jgi:hypothetical protein
VAVRGSSKTAALGAIPAQCSVPICFPAFNPKKATSNDEGRPSGDYCFPPRNLPTQCRTQKAITLERIRLRLLRAVRE